MRSLQSSERVARGSSLTLHYQNVNEIKAMLELSVLSIERSNFCNFVCIVFEKFFSIIKIYIDTHVCMGGFHAENENENF